MQRLQNIFKRLLAALTFFTRLPLWRLCTIPAECYERVVPLWPLAGWVTGGMMAVVYFIAMQVLPMEVSIMLALASRVLLTGALHEDGFADFCDGFGGGTTRERTLEIMKDSHIGTFGVLGLIIYYMLMYNALCALMPVVESPMLFIAVDAMAKGLSSAIIIRLPYARKESEAKNKLVYAPYPWAERVLCLVWSFLPFLALHSSLINYMLISVITGAVVVNILFIWMKHRIGGYTGDCCGATFIVTELMMYLVLLTLLH